MRRLTALALLLVAAGPALADLALERKVAALLPRPEEEVWRAVPWHLNLMRARAEAQRTGKPLLVWIMDGHVQACT